jgi:5,10-methylenetetrahydrofolate reductase
MDDSNHPNAPPTWRNAGVSFTQRLGQRPVLVEVIPPARGAPASRVEQALAHVGELLHDAPVDAVNIPEIIGSGFQSMDALDFGLLVHHRFGVDIVVNKVVVHEPAANLSLWLDRLLASDAASAILVGGERSGIYYPGPSVLEANRLARERAEAAGRPDFALGNVTLPTRTGEAGRMLAKAERGADYFTSQIVYEFPTANAHLQAYDDVCALAGVAPKPVLYAFSPAANAQDILFLRYLGVHVPPEVEQALL